MVHHEQQLEYWIRQLEGSQPAVLPYDKPRPHVLSGETDEATVVVEGPLYKSLQEFCSIQQATPSVVLLSAFRATHFRMTGTEDATIGSLVANRNRYETENLTGVLANLQCIRSTVQNESFESLVHQIKNTTATAFENQDIPLEEIVAELKPSHGDVSQNPLIQITFAAYTYLDRDRLALQDLQVDAMATSKKTRFDLEFNLHETELGFSGKVIFAQDLFYCETIKAMISVFYKVLKQGLHEPKAAICSLPLVGSLSSSYDDNTLQPIPLDYPRESSIIDVFRKQVSICSSTVAVKDASTQLTYAELDQQSEHLFWWLVEQKFDAETPVGVFANRSCQTIVAFLGILKAGLAYLPLDVNAPPGRTKIVLSSTPGCKLIFLGEGLPQRNIQSESIKTVRLSEILTEQAEKDNKLHVQTVEHVAGPCATSLASIYFTSGSTGTPKGVMTEHRGIIRLVMQPNVTSRLQIGTRIAHLANIAFDASTWEVYTALLHGGTIVCLDLITVLDTSNLYKALLLENIRMAKFTPALLHQCLLEFPHMFRQLDVLLIVGDRVNPYDAHKVTEWISGDVFNGYGPTESTGHTTTYKIRQHQTFPNGVPIGRAIENSSVHVMDSKQQLVPAGVIGELVVTGDGLARGYLNTQQNQDRFISVRIRGQLVRAYRTGDLVRCRPFDRQLEFIGRIDHQVKIRGYRIELGEVEHALLGNNKVNDAVVVVRKNGEPRLVGFVTLHASQEADSSANTQNGDTQSIPEQLRSYLQVKLPVHMVPSTVVVLKQMPINQNRKVDRRALATMAEMPETGQNSNQNLKHRVAPRNDTEHALCEEFSVILGVEVGITDNFFSLGGHSLMATRVISRINKRLHCSITVFDFYQSPTPNVLSETIRHGCHPETPQNLPSYLHHHKVPNARATMVLIHGYWGQGNFFLPLIPLLDSYFDVILVHDPFFGKPESPATIKEWATFYLNDLQTCVSAKLPVIFGGFSFGGLIAFEMASLWRDIFGRDLASIFLLDAASSPSLAEFLSLETLPEQAVHRGLAIFGNDQVLLVKQHFEKLRSLSLQGLEQYIYEGDCLYIPTPEAYHVKKVDWWQVHCPNVHICRIDSDHYEVLSHGMVETVARLVNEHYHLLID